MMLRRVLVILSLIVSCYCLEHNETQPEEARAKKRKGSLRLLAIIALVILSKVVIAKVVTFVAFVAFFQKLFYIGGLLLSYFLKNQQSGPPPVMYGPPQEYNTVGYSYEPPETEPFRDPEGLPSLADFSGGVNWLFNKNQQ